MPKLFTDQQLDALAIPPAHAPQHQLQLKRALLSSVPPRPATLMTKWRTLMTKKPFLTTGLTLGAAVLALTAGAFIMPQGSTASAQSLAKQSYRAVSNLSPADKQKLLQHTSANTQDQLREAQAAKDLQTLTYDQVIVGHFMPLPPAKAPVSDAPDLHALKYLKYTNAQGATIILGLDAHNLPVISMVAVGTPGSAPTGTQGIQMLQTNGTTPAGGQMIHADGANPATPPANATFGGSFIPARTDQTK